MNHFFDIEHAKEYGIDEAIILSYLSSRTQKNIENQYNFHDNSYWISNSIESWLKLFPYMTTNRIRIALSKLEKLNLIKSGNYNKIRFDCTK